MAKNKKSVPVQPKRQEDLTIHISYLDSLKGTRSPFATMKITGNGPHKSKKDFNRQANKLETKKLMKEYK